MLFEYSACERIEVEDNKRPLQRIESRLIGSAIVYSKMHWTMSALNVFASYLATDIGKLYCTKELLYILIVLMRDKNLRNNIVNTLSIYYNTKDRDCYFLVQIFLVLENALEYKSNASKGTEGHFGGDCMESITAYIVHFLLLVPWEEVFRKAQPVADSELKELFSSGSSEPCKSAVGKREMLLKLLSVRKGSDRHKQTRDIIIDYLFREAGENLLGKRVYKSLLSHALSDPKMFYVEWKYLPKVVENKDTFSRFKDIYSKIFLHIKKFTVDVQKEMLNDVLNASDVFLKYLLELEVIFNVTLEQLKSSQYHSDTELKDLLEKTVLLYLSNYAEDTSKNQHLKRALISIRKLKIIICLEVFEKVLMELVKSAEWSDDMIFGVTQLVYFAEDILAELKTSTDIEFFVKFVGKLMLYLDHHDILYFWYSPLPQEAEGFQREGGIARAVFKLLLGALIHCPDTSKAFDLLSKLLSFFLYHQEETFRQIAKILQVEEYFAQFKESSAGFMGEKFDSGMSKRYLAIYRRPKNYYVSIENLFETRNKRIFYVLTLLAQTFIYTSYRVDKYKDITSEMQDLMQENIVNTKRSNKLAMIIARIGSILDIVRSMGFDAYKEFDVLLGELNRLEKPREHIDGCYSTIDFLYNKYSKEELKKMKSAAKQRSSSVTAVEKREDQKLAGESAVNAKKCLETLQDIGKIYDKCMKDVSAADKKKQKDCCILEVKKLLLSKEFIKNRMKALHDVITESTLKIDLLIQLELMDLKAQSSMQELTPKLTRKMQDCLAGMKGTLSKYRKESLTLCPTVSTAPRRELIGITSTLKNAYKDVMQEAAFAAASKEDKEVYKAVATEYDKLLKRCALTSENALKWLTGDVDGFVKVDLVKDGLGRQMRLKEMKSPLENESVRVGIVYMRGVLLKRAIVRRLACKASKKERLPLVSSSVHVRILRAMFDRFRRKISVLNVSTVDVPCRPSLMLSLEDEKEAFNVDMIRLDHAVFGSLSILKSGLVFISAQSSINPFSHEYGPLESMRVVLKPMKKVWRYKDITQIIARRYNLLKQAIEIFLKNGKSIFFVIYPMHGVEVFFTTLKGLLSSNTSYRIELIENSKEAFKAGKFTESWRQGKMTTFEYLMKLNHYGGRSFRDLSQYPVFPWVLSNYASDKFETPPDHRDFSRPIAALTEAKVKKACVTYKHSDDVDEEKFQFGTHYLPGRTVLGYLMRLQPYTFMLNRFDSGNDAPSRNFNEWANLWENALTQIESNYELVPEFFYNPDSLVNYNKYFFGRKSFEKHPYHLQGRIVQVDGMVLPQWAVNNHHFVAMNSLSLESREVKESVHEWINLVFGVYQQSAEKYNLFSPLCDEAMVRRKYERGQLNEGELSQVSGMGQNPMRLFDSPHPKYLNKDETAFHPFDEVEWFTEEIALDGEMSKSTVVRFMFVDDDYRALYFLAVTDSNELKQGQISNKSVKMKSYDLALSEFKIFEGQLFKLDPCSVFAISENCLISGLRLDNTFTVTKFYPTRESTSITFHKAIVTAVHIGEKKFFTGDYNGLVAVWLLSSLPKKNAMAPKFFFNDHETWVVSIDSSAAVDLYASASDSEICLRVLSTQRYLRTIAYEPLSGRFWAIYKVFLSAKGYIVLQLRRRARDCDEDAVVVYSINGVKVIERRLKELLNSIVMEPTTQYHIITGGVNGVTKKYFIITMEEEILDMEPSAILFLDYIESNGLIVGFNNKLKHLYWELKDD